MTHHAFTGLWTTDDGFIRHEILPNGRYVEARGNRERAYQGRYEIRGTRISYKDDAGFVVEGEFQNNVLHHPGMRLRRA